jgi:gliding motility-associated-like protein
VTGDDLTVNKTATFNNKNIGTGKTVSVSGISLTGTDAGNYTYTSAIDAGTASITVRSLTISATTSDKVYDGNTNANVTLTDNRISGDVFTVDKTATFNNKNIGTDKAVAVSGITLTGTDAGNYTLTNATTTSAGTASITVRSLTITATVLDKMYDGNTTANATLTDNRVTGDDLTVNKTATFNNKNIGTGKAVTVSGIILTGTDAGNYTITNTTAAGTASITIRNLTISATVLDKVYDGNANATATLTDNKLTGDDLTLNKTGVTFNNKNVGSGKTFTVTGITLTGTDAGNYTITNATATGTASITAKSLTITATAANKEYDGNVNAVVVFSDNRISGDVLTVNKTGSKFNDKNTGVGKAINITGINLTGVDAGNYSLTSSTITGTASITARGITISAIAMSKPYDGNKIAAVTLSDDKISGDIITPLYTLAEFDTKEIGNNKTVTVTGISIQGLDVLNYNLNNITATANANITGNPNAILIFPNAFTPNGDGNNDIFKIASSNTLGKASFLYFEIYNRNGQLMGKRYDNINDGWDGKHKDVIQDMGIYFVKLVKMKDGKQVVENAQFYLLK